MNGKIRSECWQQQTLHRQQGIHTRLLTLTVCFCVSDHHGYYCHQGMFVANELLYTPVVPFTRCCVVTGGPHGFIRTIQVREVPPGRHELMLFYSERDSIQSAGRLAYLLICCTVTRLASIS